MSLYRVYSSEVLICFSHLAITPSHFLSALLLRVHHDLVCLKYYLWRTQHTLVCDHRSESVFLSALSPEISVHINGNLVAVNPLHCGLLMDGSVFGKYNLTNETKVGFTAIILFSISSKSVFIVLQKMIIWYLLCLLPVLCLSLSLPLPVSPSFLSS